MLIEAVCKNCGTEHILTTGENMALVCKQCGGQLRKTGVIREQKQERRPVYRAVNWSPGGSYTYSYTTSTTCDTATCYGPTNSTGTW